MGSCHAFIRCHVFYLLSRFNESEAFTVTLALVLRARSLALSGLAALLRRHFFLRPWHRLPYAHMLG